MKKKLNVKMIIPVLMAVSILGCSKKEVPVNETENETGMEQVIKITEERYTEASADETSESLEDYYYREENGEIIIESYMGNSPKVAVPAEIDGFPVTTIQYEAFRQGTLVEVELPDGIKTIQKDAFMFCKELEKVVLGSAVETIEEKAFAYCIKLNSINLPESIRNIERSVFSGCHELKDITLPVGITEIPGGVFFEAGINEIEIPDGVTALGAQSLAYCNNLKEVMIPSSVTEIEFDTFEGSKSVTIITPGGSAAEAFAKENGIPVENK